MGNACCNVPVGYGTFHLFFGLICGENPGAFWDVATPRAAIRFVLNDLQYRRKEGLS
jgi:hypothetical protein